MSHPYRDTARAAARLDRIRSSEGAGPDASGGGDDAGQATGAQPFRRGGAVEIAGETVKRRLDRPGKPNAYATGGAVRAGRGKTNVNIIIAPQGGGAAAAPAPVPMPVPMPPPGPLAGPPAPMGPPPIDGPQIPPEALAALASRAGGEPPALIARKRGGRVPIMEAGAGSGEGRLEKADKHGAKPKK